MRVITELVYVKGYTSTYNRFSTDAVREIIYRGITPGNLIKNEDLHSGFINFIKTADNGRSLHIHHITENTTNNDLSNLALVTNSVHGKINGLLRRFVENTPEYSEELKRIRSIQLTPEEIDQIHTDRAAVAWKESEQEVLAEKQAELLIEFEAKAMTEIFRDYPKMSDCKHAIYSAYKSKSLKRINDYLEILKSHVITELK